MFSGRNGVQTTRTLAWPAGGCGSRAVSIESAILRDACVARGDAVRKVFSSIAPAQNAQNFFFGNVNWGGANWDWLFIAASTSMFRIQLKVSGNRLPYMR